MPEADAATPRPLAVVGHQGARAQLRALGAHALLFCGPEGVGRRHVARWYAALLNCASRNQTGDPTGDPAEPCGRCDSCRLFEQDAHPDYREVAPPETTGSGKRQRRPEIRIGQLVPRAGESDEPLSSWLERRPAFRVRLGVIDAAERLNASAANAFLKFLEEPPSYCRIVLIAPSQQAVLATVASRCTPVRFGPVTFASGDDPHGANAYADLAPHPALRLGRVGALERSRAEREAFEEARERADRFVAALDGDLEGAFEAADALEKALTNPAPVDVGDLLREAVRERQPALAALAEDAFGRCETALASYANPGLAVQVLALELRAALGKGR